MPEQSRAGRAPRGGAPRVTMLVSVVFLLVALAAVASALFGGWGAWSGIAGSTGAQWQIRPLWLASAVASGGAALWISGAIWGAMFRASGGRSGIREAAAMWLGSNLGRYLPGKIWQVTGLVGFVRARGDSGAGALATLLVFQALMLASGAGIAVAALGAGAFEGVGAWPVVLGGLGVAAALTPPVLRLVVRLGGRLLREPGEIEEVPLRGSLLIRAAAGSLLVWLLHGFGFWALLEGLVADNPVGPVVACGVFSASYVIGYLAVIAPGGIVVREGAMASLLGVVSTISLGPAAALALAARLWTTVAELAAFGVGLALARWVGGRSEPQRERGSL
ncbi:hypothetical protein [Candidatus Palauibacter sp.]|uniref:hypothetical protein n=1 Tax=Candidatus Palauibacter sp. TaxID=3101350 RepID=UPI003AF2DF6B